MISGVLFGIYSSWMNGSPESQSFAKGMIVIAIWISYFLVQMPFRLKSIETSDKGILIKDFKKQTIVEYRDIHWITKFDITGPWFMTIMYRDKVSGLDKKISFIPSQSDQRFFSNDSMSDFIKDKIKTHNLDYSKETQPSLIRNLLLLSLLGLPVLLLTLYFMGDLTMFFK